MKDMPSTKTLLAQWRPSYKIETTRNLEMMWVKGDLQIYTPIYFPYKLCHINKINLVHLCDCVSWSPWIYLESWLSWVLLTELTARLCSTSCVFCDWLTCDSVHDSRLPVTGFWESGVTGACVLHSEVSTLTEPALWHSTAHTMCSTMHLSPVMPVLWTVNDIITDRADGQ